MIAPAPARLAAVTADGREVLYFGASGTLMAVSAEGGAPRTVDGDPAELVYATRSALWMFKHTDPRTLRADLSVYVHGTSTTARTLIEDVPIGLLFPSADGLWAITATTGSGSTSTSSVDLVAVHAEGRSVPILADVQLGSWDEVTHRYRGPCATHGAIVTATSAVVIACTRGRTTRSLFSVGLDGGSGGAARIQDGVLSFLRVSPDRSFVLFASSGSQLYGLAAGGAVAIPLADPRPVTSVTFIGPRRFVYSSENGTLEAAEWPSLSGSTLVPFGVGLVRQASPTGDHVLFSADRQDPGTLFLAQTATAASPLVLSDTHDAISRDDAFSSDGRFVFWFARTDPSSLIGLAMSSATGVASTAAPLATQALFVQNLAAPERVMVMAHAHVLGGSQVTIADLALRNRDGSGEIEILATGVDAYDFIVFPSRDRIVYRVPVGSNAGVWVRSLP